MRDRAKKGLLIYQELFDPLRVLSDEKLGRLVRAGMAYVVAIEAGEDPETPDFGKDDALACNWVFFRQSLDAAAVSYSRSRERAAGAAAARWKGRKL